ncbi:MAG: FlgD immunoglobulin-like domain containing protein [bacterium]
MSNTRELNLLHHRQDGARAIAALVIAMALAGAAATHARAAECANTSVGLTPITELGSGSYRGVAGGLYPNASNTIPSEHLAAGLAEAGAVVPRNSAGQHDAANGRIVVLTIGMSNCSYESDAFVALAGADPLRNPRVVVVNGAQPNQSALEISDPGAPFWSVVDARLAALGLSPSQVQVIWFKQANESPSEPFPLFANILNDQFITIMRIIRDRYTKARLAYCSSRTYGGYAAIDLNPEPFAYQSAFAVKWLIKDQIDGDPALNFSAANGAVEAPWIAWGPYLWADGLTPRADGLTWECADFWESDGTHPSDLGTAKVAQMLLTFFQTHPTTVGWYLDDSATRVSGGAFGESDSGALRAGRIRVSAPRPNPFNPHVVIPIEVLQEGRVRIDVVSAAGRRVATLLDRALARGPITVTWDGVDDAGRATPSGTYLLSVESGGRIDTGPKLTLLR